MILNVFSFLTLFVNHFVSLFACIMQSCTAPPEFSQAFEVLHKHLLFLLLNRRVIPQQLSDELWMYSGNVSHVTRSSKIRDVPSGVGWRWNQAKRKYVIKHHQTGISLELLKLVPRKSVRSTLTNLPKLKLWQGTCTDEHNPITVFWCEKGLDSNETSPNDLNISDYEFLAPFMDQHLGEELWPHTVYTATKLESSSTIL